MKKLFSVLPPLFYSTIIFAGNTECLDPSGNFYYHKYQQDGGPCCGRESSQLKYKNTNLKETLVIYGRYGNDDTQDSNSNLVIKETNFVDMQNAYQDEMYEYSTHAINLSLQNLDGTVISSEINKSNITVSMICIRSRSLLPIP